MDNAPHISIVLPVWNGERYLRQAIESILNQTYKDFELIIVNDCSTDESLKIAKSYQDNDSRIVVISNEKNLKLPASLNQGFSVARGDYFTWTSDDNVLKRNFLETLLCELKESNVDVIYSDFNSIDAEGNFINLSQVGNSEELVSQNTIGASFMYKREVHESIEGYDVGKFLYEDYDFWVRAYLAGFKFKKVNVVVYDYRRHEGALTSTRSMPDDYAIYRFNLRKKFSNISRAAAYDAREILLGYRRELGKIKTLQILLEATCLDPVKTCNYVFLKLKKIPIKLFKLIVRSTKRAS